MSEKNPNDVQGDTPLTSQVGGSYYKDMKIQWVEIVHKDKVDAILGMAIKYLLRWDKKYDTIQEQIKELRKARHYIDLKIELLENDNNLIK